jgi:hypothetical protein
MDTWQDAYLSGTHARCYQIPMAFTYVSRFFTCGDFVLSGTAHRDTESSVFVCRVTGRRTIEQYRDTRKRCAMRIDDHAGHDSIGLLSPDRMG